MQVCTIQEAPDRAILSLRPFFVTQAKYADFDPESVRAILRADNSVGFSTEAKQGPTLAQLQRAAQRYEGASEKTVLLFSCRVGENVPYIGIGSAPEIGQARITKDFLDPNPKPKKKPQ